MQIVAEIRRSDLAHLHFYLVPRLKGNWILVAVIALAVIAWAIYTSRGPLTVTKLAIAVFSGLVGGIIGTLIGTTLNLLGVLAMSSKGGVLGCHEYELRADGLFERTSANEQLAKWSGIDAIEMIGSLIYVRINGYLFHLIPRRSFATDSAYAEFFERLRSSWRAAAA